MEAHRLIRHHLRVAARKALRPKVLAWLLPLIIIAPLLVILIDKDYWEFRDNDPDRGAAAGIDPQTGAYQKPIYLDQHWTQRDSLWFYETTQGSDLLPYDFFLTLEDANREVPLRAVDNVERWHFLPQHKTTRNPDALPVGFAADQYQGKDYVGLTCAACHTSQMNYQGKAIRIDGGPSMANVQQFLEDLGAALDAVAPAAGGSDCANPKCVRFVAGVKALGHYKMAQDVVRDLEVYRNRIAVYNQINQPVVPYGYARLDAFGRIFNRVLQHVLQREQLKALLPSVFEDANELHAVQAALTDVLGGNHGTAENDDLDKHVIEYVLPRLTPPQQRTLIGKLFNVPNAPVSYPFLWDIAQHDYVQWNGLVANAGLGPLGRNTGEVIGVFASLDWQQERGLSLSAILGGQGFKKNHISYHSSARVDELRRIELQLAKLESPLWPTGFFDPKYDAKPEQDLQVVHGRTLFAEYCARCHSNIDRASPQRRVVASMSSTSALGTDPTMAFNSFSRMGYSGLLRNQYVATFGVGDVLIDNKAPVVAELSKVAAGVIADPYPGWNVFMRGFEWLHQIYLSFVHNEIHPSIKSGDYEPDTTANPFASLNAYKGRSLNGIWATAPYLHNGSVPSLKALLLPKNLGIPDPGQEYRPDTFYVGSREFDPSAVGYQSDQGDESLKFDTALPGNNNKGHEYGTVNDPQVQNHQKLLLMPDDRRDLLEYLKTL